MLKSLKIFFAKSCFKISFAENANQTFDKFNHTLPLPPASNDTKPTTKDDEQNTKLQGFIVGGTSVTLALALLLCFIGYKGYKRHQARKSGKIQKTGMELENLL